MKTTEIEWIRDNIIRDKRFKLFKYVQEKQFCIEFISEEIPFSFTSVYAKDADSLYYQLKDILKAIIEDVELDINILLQIDNGYYVKAIKLRIEEILETNDREYSEFVPRGSDKMVFLKPFSIS